MRLASSTYALIVAYSSEVEAHAAVVKVGLGIVWPEQYELHLGYISTMATRKRGSSVMLYTWSF